MSLLAIIAAIPLIFVGSAIALLFVRDPKRRKILKTLLLVTLGLLAIFSPTGIAGAGGMFFLAAILVIPLGLISSAVALIFVRDPNTRKVLKIILLVTLGLLVIGGGLCALLVMTLNLKNIH